MPKVSQENLSQRDKNNEATTSDLCSFAFSYIQNCCTFAFLYVRQCIRLMFLLKVCVTKCSILPADREFTASQILASWKTCSGITHTTKSHHLYSTNAASLQLLWAVWVLREISNIYRYDWTMLCWIVLNRSIFNWGCCLLWVLAFTCICELLCTTTSCIQQPSFPLWVTL